MKYLILDVMDGGIDSTLEALESKVEAYLACGWRPCGGVSIIKLETGGYCAAQTIIHDGDGPLPQ